MAGVNSAFAQEDDSLEPAPVDSAHHGASKIKRVVKRGKTNRHWQVRPGLAFWQENIDLRSGMDSAQMQSQSEGILVDVAYVITPYRSRWRQIYGFEFGNGRVKGKGNTLSIPDELRGQTWLIAGASASVMYRSSLYSEFGLIAPFNYRTISWALKSDSTLDPDKDTSFSVGLGLAYLIRFDRRQGIHFAMIRHFGWDATMWTASYQLEFN
jgi:hypothetical protein